MVVKSIVNYIKRRMGKDMDNNKNSNVVWIFFNCDQYRSTTSMNPFYNRTVYRKRDGRRLLWKKIKNECDKNRIIVPEDKMSDIRSMILEGNPEDANAYIQYGYIVEMLENQEQDK